MNYFNMDSWLSPLPKTTIRRWLQTRRRESLGSRGRGSKPRDQSQPQLMGESGQQESIQKPGIISKSKKERTGIAQRCWAEVAKPAANSTMTTLI